MCLLWQIFPHFIASDWPSWKMHVFEELNLIYASLFSEKINIAQKVLKIMQYALTIILAFC